MARSKQSGRKSKAKATTPSEVAPTEEIKSVPTASHKTKAKAAAAGQKKSAPTTKKQPKASIKKVVDELTQEEKKK
jgi:hypothetical protein